MQFDKALLNLEMNFIYIGMWMVVDPVGIATLPELVVRTFRSVGQSLAGAPGPPAVPEDAEILRRVRRALRCAGVALLLFALAV